MVVRVGQMVAISGTGWSNSPLTPRVRYSAHQVSLGTAEDRKDYPPSHHPVITGFRLNAGPCRPGIAALQASLASPSTWKRIRPNFLSWVRDHSLTRSWLSRLLLRLGPFRATRAGRSVQEMGRCQYRRITPAFHTAHTSATGKGRLYIGDLQCG